MKSNTTNYAGRPCRTLKKNFLTYLKWKQKNIFKPNKCVKQNKTKNEKIMEIKKKNEKKFEKWIKLSSKRASVDEICGREMLMTFCVCDNNSRLCLNDEKLVVRVKFITSE